MDYLASENAICFTQLIELGSQKSYKWLRNQNHQALILPPLPFFAIPTTLIQLSRFCYHLVKAYRHIEPEDDNDLQYDHILLKSWYK